MQELISSALTGIFVGLGCAVPILIVATLNVFVGLMAAVNITLITATVLGFIPMMGWKLGVRGIISSFIHLLYIHVH